MVNRTQSRLQRPRPGARRRRLSLSGLCAGSGGDLCDTSPAAGHTEQREPTVSCGRRVTDRPGPCVAVLPDSTGTGGHKTEMFPVRHSGGEDTVP